MRITKSGSNTARGGGVIAPIVNSISNALNLTPDNIFYRAIYYLLWICICTIVQVVLCWYYDVSVSLINLVRCRNNLVENSWLVVKNIPATGEELSAIAGNMGCGDIFPEFTEEELSWIKEDGKIPRHSRWADRIAKGELAVDTLLSLAGLASFAKDQQKLDQRIRSLISGI